MSKKRDFKQSLVQYIHDALGVDVHLQALNKRRLETLPLTMLGNFSFLETEMLQTKVVFAIAEDGDAVTPAQLKRLLEIAAKKLERVIIFVPCKIASYNLHRLVHQRVNLIIPGKQMFLPELIINLRRDIKTNNDLTDIIPPLAQVIILYQIEVDMLEGRSIKEISSIFKVSYATANRAIRWLNTHGLCSLVADDRTKSLHFGQTKRDLWKAAKPLLASPVEKTVYTDERIDNRPTCGINALSEYGMLVGEHRDWYAMTKRQLSQLHIKTDDRFGDNVIEIWRYDPSWLTTTKIVDRLSLYLSLEGNDDERVQMELDNMISSMTW